MSTLTIPRNIIKNDDLVVMPRKEYEELIRTQRFAERQKAYKVKKAPIFRTPKKHQKFYNKLNQEIDEALQDVRDGRTYGPFDNAEDAIKFLHRKR